MAELCHEAVGRFGTDWDLIARYLKERIATLPAEDRRALNEEMRRILSFCAPQRPIHMQ
jgi:hypothetical protein